MSDTSYLLNYYKSRILYIFFFCICVNSEKIEIFIININSNNRVILEEENKTVVRLSLFKTLLDYIRYVAKESAWYVISH